MLAGCGPYSAERCGGPPSVSKVYFLRSLWRFTFVFSQSGERVVISPLHWDLRVVIGKWEGRNHSLSLGFENDSPEVAGSQSKLPGLHASSFIRI